MFIKTFPVVSMATVFNGSNTVHNTFVLNLPEQVSTLNIKAFGKYFIEPGAIDPFVSATIGSETFAATTGNGSWLLSFNQAGSCSTKLSLSSNLFAQAGNDPWISLEGITVTGSGSCNVPEPGILALFAIGLLVSLIPKLRVGSK